MTAKQLREKAAKEGWTVSMVPTDEGVHLTVHLDEHTAVSKADETADKAAKALAPLLD